MHKLDYKSEAGALESVSGLAEKEVIDVATHPEADHFLALTTDGDVYSWGSGEGGRLGHGDLQ